MAEIVLLIAGLALFGSAACRAIRHMDGSTRADVRWAIAAQGAAGLASTFVPLLRPDLLMDCAAALAASSAAVQIITSRLWPHGGTPAPFVRSTPHHPGRSRVWSEP